MGYKKDITREGTGEVPKKGDKIAMHYTGTYTDAQTGQEIVFDSSRKRGEPLTFHAGRGQVIRGWDEAVLTMSKKEKAILTIDPDYAYGDSGIPGVIPPSCTLVFDVELMKINDRD
eukprot:TRINITY_DN74375_c0_g1_i1.p1 TRINITY_DN74375_c0_g1~~TRINITY_DN74375_c0_g1_i1.p1  ORF type:complete len:116 (+),score=8.52 TRINITY_DN74375_c0_g1_i1:100-447(+)